jgi:hypothetical protein
MLVHLHSSQARYAVFCAQYGSRQWPPHERASDDLGRPAYCQLKVMAIAAESCAELRPAYEGVVRKMLDAVEVVVDVEGGMRATADSLKQQEPELFSLNALLHEMGLAQLTHASLLAMHQALRATYTIASCASAAYPPVSRRPNAIRSVALTEDAHYPTDFRTEATHAVHLFCYKLLRNGGSATALVLPSSSATFGVAPTVSTLAPPAAPPTAPTPVPTPVLMQSSFSGNGNGGFDDDAGGGDDAERVRFGDIMEEIAGSDELDFDAQQELKMMAGMTMAQMDRKRKFTRPRDDLGGRIYTEADREAMGAAITRCMAVKNKRAK